MDDNCIYMMFDIHTITVVHELLDMVCVHSQIVLYAGKCSFLYTMTMVLHEVDIYRIFEHDYDTMALELDLHTLNHEHCDYIKKQK
jgi:hypothetical protein